MGKRGGEISLSSVGKILSHSAEKLRGEPFNVSEKLGFWKILCIGRGYYDIPCEFFCFSTRNLLRWNLVCFRKLWASKNFFWEKEWGYHVPTSNYFCLTVPRKFVGYPSMFQSFRKIRVLENFMFKKGIERYSVWIFCFSIEKILRWNLMCLRNDRVSKKFMLERGWGYHGFSSNIFCLTVPEIFVGEPSMFQKR